MDTFKVIRKYDQKELRATIEQTGDYFVFAPNKRIRGYRYNPDEFKDRYDIKIKTISDEEQWHKRLKKIVKKINKTQNWVELLPLFENLLRMSYDDHEYIKRNYSNRNDLYQKFHIKYPFLFTQDKEGKIYIVPEYYYDISDAILKTMYFGYSNHYYKKCIKNALNNQTTYHTGRIISNYDVSYEYNAQKHKAWYSEEYRNCGNGHYYLALDENTAIFYEND